jgi:5-methylcytosine-specific restriction enzyme A
MPWKPPVHGAAERQAAQAAYRRAHDRQRGSPSQRGYGRPWQRLRQMALERDHYRCVRCGRSVDASAPVDHIRAKAKGGADRLDNLETLCASCHSRKTVVEDGGFGNNASGVPPTGGEGSSPVPWASTTRAASHKNSTVLV